MGGNYIRDSSADNIVITVQRGTVGSIGGGGFLVNAATVAGAYKPDAGLKTNFGMNVKFNKNGTNLQGAANIILRRTEIRGGVPVLAVYQIKSNATDTLTTSAVTGGSIASFSSKANFTDITDPYNPISVSSVGNGVLQVTLTDKGEPGTSDTVGISYYDKVGALVYSNNWNGTKTVETLLGGGNIQVRPAQLFDGPVGVVANAATTITADDVKALLPAALAQWQAAGVDSRTLATLRNVDIQVDNFDDDGLGWAMPGVITIDQDAAGHGWFVNSTPGARVPAERVDLLTVLTHELGHLVGRNEIFGDSNDIMAVALPVGARRSPVMTQFATPNPVSTATRTVAGTSRAVVNILPVTKAGRSARPNHTFLAGVKLPVNSQRLTDAKRSTRIRTTLGHIDDFLSDIARSIVRDKRKRSGPRA